MILQLIKEEDVAEVLEIYAPYVQNTAITFEYEVPSLESFSERVHHYTEQYPWIVAKDHGKIVGYAYASLYRNREAYQWCCELSVYLRPEVQGRDLGRTLYSALMDLLTLQGYYMVYGVITPVSDCIINSVFLWTVFRKTAVLNWEAGIIRRSCQRLCGILSLRPLNPNPFMKFRTM